ncbi:MAG: PHA-depolymerase-like protein [Pseudomonadota bacterium]
MNIRFLILSAVMLVLPAPDLQAQVVSLPKFNVNLNETSVSGLSSGGYMAVQFHVAYSALVKGAGIIAGGPYFCAKDDQNTATSICSCTGFTGCQPAQAALMVPELIQITNQSATQGGIDPTSNLSGARVWLFSGVKDTVVPPPVMQALETYYKNYIPPSNIFFEQGVVAEHAMPTELFGNACDFRGDPFINKCPFDAAGKLLGWIYGTVNPRNTGTLGGQFIEFDQSEFLPSPATHGMWPTGWVYVPAACQQNTQCRVHVVFHGCKQYPGAPFGSGPQGRIADVYVKNSGYNVWADTNQIIVLYPQANVMNVGTRLPRSNPNGCWDWWGYDDANYAQKSGRQMLAVKKMVDRLAGVTTPTPPSPPPPPSPGTPFCGSASNADHVMAGRAYKFFFWTYFANGSNDFLGWSEITVTTLKEVVTGTYQKVAACP